jgi:enoyl-CoA hydratase/carnithine racemase
MQFITVRLCLHYLNAVPNYGHSNHDYEISILKSEMLMEPIRHSDELHQSVMDGVLTLTLSRPAALNALTPELIDSLGSALALGLDDAAVQVVVLTGAGRGFCAGVDLKATELRSAVPRGNVAFIAALGSLVQRIASYPKPVIAAVNGIAVAGGLELVLACDQVIAARSARLGDAHANYAMFPGAGATVRLPRRIGLAKAKYLMFSGALWSADESLQAGLVDLVVPDEDLLPAAWRLAALFVGKSPLVIARMKEAMGDSLHQPPEIGLRRERDLNELHAMSADRREGLAAFREKRVPQFTGT